MNNYIDLLAKSLKNIGLKCWIDEKKRFVRTGFKVDKLKYELFISVFEQVNAIRIAGPQILEVPKEKYFDVLELINTQNARIVYGSFIIREVDDKYYIEFRHFVHLIKNIDDMKFFEKELDDIFTYTGYEMYELLEKYRKIVGNEIVTKGK